MPAGEFQTYVGLKAWEVRSLSSDGGTDLVTRWGPESMRVERTLKVWEFTIIRPGRLKTADDRLDQTANFSNFT